MTTFSCLIYMSIYNLFCPQIYFSQILRPSNDGFFPPYATAKCLSSHFLLPNRRHQAAEFQFCFHRQKKKPINPKTENNSAPETLVTIKFFSFELISSISNLEICMSYDTFVSKKLQKKTMKIHELNDRLVKLALKRILYIKVREMNPFTIRIMFTYAKPIKKIFYVKVYFGTSGILPKQWLIF